jgi:hypothetical protein
VKFPVYKTLPCYNVSGHSVKCSGTAFLYTEWLNDARNNVTFPKSPAVTIATTGKFPGTKSCQAIDLRFSNGLPSYWLILPIKGTPSKGRVSFASAALPIDVYGSEFWVIGFTCQ